MKVKDLIRKLNVITEKCGDFEIYVDAGDLNLMHLEKVYIGGMWNIVLSCDEDQEDIEDDSTISFHKNEKK